MPGLYLGVLRIDNCRTKGKDRQQQHSGINPDMCCAADMLSCQKGSLPNNIIVGWDYSKGFVQFHRLLASSSIQYLQASSECHDRGDFICA